VAASVTRPLNVVVGMLEPGITAQDLAQAGVKRISIGGALCRLALAHVMKGAREMKEQGSFTWLAEMMPAQELKRIF
jgi:2-methylisocitrate lyase-like PEP mutase family enzyme